jgi:hypothetical protein
MNAQKNIRSIKDLDKDQLLEYVRDLSKRWLAHDGLWFLAAEQKFGIEAAIELDGLAWEKFTVIEAQRIMKFLDIKSGGGLDALEAALNFRLYANINKQSAERPDVKTLVFTMDRCRVQEARKRKNLPDFPCKEVGLLEYSNFAKTIDKRIRTECVFCPPGSHPEDAYCRWSFTME